MPKYPIFNSAYALDRAAFAHPDRPSITYGDRTWTVAEAALTTRKLAQLFAQAGVAEGDRVLVAAHNSPYHLFAHVACARLGAVFVPVSYRLTQYELQNLVDFCSPRAVICEPEIAARGGLSSTGTLLQFVIDDDVQAGPLSGALQNGFLALSAAIAPFDGELVADSESRGADALGGRDYPNGLAAILFTSGSSGTPKAVALTHENLWWGSQNFREGFEYRSDETELVVAPLSHIGGFNGTTLDLFSHGGHVVVVRAFDPATVLRLIEEHHVNIMFGVPTMYGALLAHPDMATRDLSSWRLPLVGGSQVPAPMLGALAAHGLRPLNVWGMTELSASGAYLPFEHLAEHPGSIGRPFANIAVRVVDPQTLEDVPVGVAGEILVRGPSVTTSFWHGEEHTRQAFVDRWLRTGDLATVSEEGFLSIVGRISDQILSGGEGIFPGEVEDVIRQYDGVKDVVVCGVPDEVWGERVVAALVMEEGAQPPSLAEIQAFAGQVLARYKLPRYLAIMDALPLGGSGKTDRAAVRSMIWAQISPRE
ncbi:AMP-binding protein [Arcanobacterium haemolyticum]|nr:AMP-binding protein [Arcanobacterium haemolyticum]